MERGYPYSFVTRRTKPNIGNVPPSFVTKRSKSFGVAIPQTPNRSYRAKKYPYLIFGIVGATIGRPRADNIRPYNCSKVVLEASRLTVKILSTSFSFAGGQNLEIISLGAIFISVTRKPQKLQNGII